jgi:hypothetical protein
MPDVIFARPRWDYQSYVDLYKLIELSGYPLTFFDEIDPFSDNLYILTILNGENQTGWYNPRARIVLYDLEWRLNGEYTLPPGVACAWAADSWYAQKIGAQYVPLGSHPDLAPRERHRNGNYDYDVATLCYSGPYRRGHALDLLRQRDLRLSPNAWDEERELILQHSRSMVHIHQWENVNTVAPQRFALAAAYKLPLITETLYKAGIFRYNHLIQADYASLPEITQQWVTRNDARILDEFGCNLWHLLCVENTFRKVIEGAV